MSFAMVSMGRMMRRSIVLGVCSAAAITAAFGAQLSQDAKAAIPKDVQQIIVVDYNSMQNSATAMSLKAQVLPPELKQLERALTASGIDDNHDIDELAFASFRVNPNSDDARVVGVAQGQFSVADILAGFRKRKVKPQLVRTNKLYPMAGSGMLVCFINPTTMLFGSMDAVKRGLDARDGLAPSILSNTTMMQQMGLVDDQPIWSLLDAKGTQQMMGSIMGQASQLSDFSTVKKRLAGSRYTMNFDNGVKFHLAVLTPDTFTAATMSSLMNAAAMYEKMSGTPVEKQAIDNTDISSNSGTLSVAYEASDSQFGTLIQSSLFQNVVH